MNCTRLRAKLTLQAQRDIATPPHVCERVSRNCFRVTVGYSLVSGWVKIKKMAQFGKLVRIPTIVTEDNVINQYGMCPSKFKVARISRLFQKWSAPSLARSTCCRLPLLSSACLHQFPPQSELCLPVTETTSLHPFPNPASPRFPPLFPLHDQCYTLPPANHRAHIPAPP